MHDAPRTPVPPESPLLDPEQLADVAAIIGSVFERIGHPDPARRRPGSGWRRLPYEPMRPGGIRRPGTARDGGVTLTEALYLASTHDRPVDEQTRQLAYAAVAMAVELRLGRPAHELLPGDLADEYLDDRTSDERLHELDVIVLDRFNADATGVDDVRELLAIAAERAPEVIAAQFDAADLRAADDALDLVPLRVFVADPSPAAGESARIER